MTTVLQKRIQEDFETFTSAGDTDLNALRRNAFAAFEAAGFPTTKNEEWKYTNLKPVTDKDFYIDTKAATSVTSLISGSPFAAIEANRLVFVNGSFAADLSVVIEKDSSIVISNISQARTQHAAVFNKHFGQYAKIEGEALNALNTALLNDGAFVYVPAGKTASHPVMIINITDTSSANVLSQPRNLIVVEKSAAVKLIETYDTTGANAVFTNVVTEVYAAANAEVEHIKMQQQQGETYHNNYTQVFQEQDTNISHFTFTLDGTLVRNNLHFYMNGENCNTLLYGLYVGSGKNHIDNHTRVDHAKPNCFSDELYKGVMKDQSVAVFNGKIIVHLDAQKTNAYQRNQNILVGEEATVNTKPQLEIFADDVKCTHGATVGQLNEEPLFYLRSRGIPEEAARKMLLNAFADDIAERVKVPGLIDIIERLIEEKL